VVVVPGFLGADWYLFELYRWLKRMGYRPYFSRIGHNAQCPDVLTHRLLKTVNRAYTETGRRVHLIGHSFGGVLARGVATRKPDRVASVIMLGSPYRGVRVHGLVLRAIHQVRAFSQMVRRKGQDCLTDACACGFMCTMRNNFPETIPLTSIYTKSDGVVEWTSCVDGTSEVDVEVKGTHVGLVWNPDVYKIVAERLATPPHTRAAARKASTLASKRIRKQPKPKPRTAAKAKTAAKFSVRKRMSAKATRAA
jgi:poly(3-hydroxyalkanoate) synthetase